MNVRVVGGIVGGAVVGLAVGLLARDGDIKVDQPIAPGFAAFVPCTVQVAVVLSVITFVDKFEEHTKGCDRKQIAWMMTTPGYKFATADGISFPSGKNSSPPASSPTCQIAPTRAVCTFADPPTNYAWTYAVRVLNPNGKALPVLDPTVFND